MLERRTAQRHDAGHVAVADTAIIARTFVELADSLVDNFDVVDLLSLLARRSVELLDVDVAGLVFVGPASELRLMAASSEAARVTELFEMQTSDGPSLDCCRSGEPIEERELATSQRWPSFTPRALEDGYRSLHALPLRLRGHVTGALNLLLVQPGGMEPGDVVLGQALADVATITILSSQAHTEMHRMNQQLQIALRTRVVIEQAKGMVAEGLRISVDAAFAALRRYARVRNLLLSDVAASVVQQRLSVEQLVAPFSPQHS